MSEILVSPGRSDLIQTKRLLEFRKHKIFGVKVLTNDSYKFMQEEKHGRYGAVACVLKNAGAQRIMVDSKIPNDTPYEMNDVTNSVIAGYLGKKMPDSKISRPDFLTVHFTAPRKSLKIFKEQAERLGITPVCFTTSSRYTEQDYQDLGTNSVDFAKRSTEAISELGFKAVMCAACDASVIKEVNPELILIGTGGLLRHDELTDHERPGVFEETKDFVDVFALGTPILQAQDVVEAFDERYDILKV